MSMSFKSASALLLATAIIGTAPAAAQVRHQIGGSNGLYFEARSNLVGVGSTATVAAGGNPIYLPPRPRNNGVVAIITDFGAGGRFICSGSLLSDRVSIATAAHCVTDANLNNPISTTVYFSNGGDVVITSDPSSQTRQVGRILTPEAYTGEVIDQNDIAILRLENAAPGFAVSYDLFAGSLNDLIEQTYTIAGVGGRSSVGGALGVDLGTGRLREGENRFDMFLGDDIFGGFFTDPIFGGERFFGTAETQFSLISDFDNGFAANDASCLLASLFGGSLSSPQFCDLGRLREVSTAGGDSGGPLFVNGQLAAITSYGLSFGALTGDAVPGLNSSFGEFNGFVPTALHRDFINRALAIPEPSTWAMLIAGFGLVGAAIRRRSRATLHSALA